MAKVGQKRTFFTKKTYASRLCLKKVTKHNHPPEQTQNYNSTWGFLKKRPSGRDLGPFLRVFEPKRPKNGGTVLEKGGTILCCPPKLICVLDAEFNVDYDSAIKHDLIQ